MRRLRRAKFRDAWFYLNERASETGRRVSSIQFPFQDLPAPQDLGKEGEVIFIQAMVIGPNYRLDAERLMKACKQENAGVLFHPYFGSRTVMCKRVRDSEIYTEGGVVYFSLTFVETKETSIGGFSLQNIPLLGMLLGNEAIKGAGNLLNDTIVRANQGLESLDEINDSILMVAEVSELTFSPLIHTKIALSNFTASLSILRQSATDLYTKGVAGVARSTINLWHFISGNTLQTNDPYAWTRHFPTNTISGVNSKIILSLQSFIVGVQASHTLSKLPQTPKPQHSLALQALKLNADRALDNVTTNPELYSTLKQIQSICIRELFGSAKDLDSYNLQHVENSKPRLCLVLEAFRNGGLRKLDQVSALYRFNHECFPDG